MRSMWSGYISFGLVNIPVKLYTAVDDKSLNLDMLHKSDFSRIRYARKCNLEEKEVPFEEIVKGYEYEPDKYVILTDEDFEKANVKKSKSISVLNFISSADIDFMNFDKPYYLEPNGSEKAYVLFSEALKKTKKSAFVKYVFKNKEHIGLVSLRDQLLVLEQLRFPDEIRKDEALNKPKKETISEKEMKVAVNLIDQMTEKFDIKNYKDTYKEELQRIIDEKKEGRIPAAKGEAPSATRIPDLMKILEQSLNEQKQKVKTK